MDIKSKLDLSDQLVELIKKKQTLEGYFHITFAKERNLLVNLTNYIKKLEEGTKHIFSEEEIRKSVLIKEIDKKIYLEEFFERKENNAEYELKKDIKTKIDGYIKKHLENKNISNEEEIKEIYNGLKNMLISGRFNKDKYNELIFKGVKLAKELHWKYLPIYEEQMILNRECTPEEKLEEYYNHYHAIEDLVDVIDGEKIELNKRNGDLTLNKEMYVKIYSNRRNSYEIYQFKRTICGWNIGILFETEETLKSGENGFFDNLKHNSIFYPEEGVKYALELLWEKADNGEANIEELQIKLQEVAYWISDVEGNLREKQPEWCNYY